MSALLSSFTAVRVSAFRRWLLSAIVANTGLQIFVTVLYWTVLQRTGSATAVGLCVGALIIAAMLFVVPAGVLADRIDVRRVIVVGQGAGMLVAVIATALSSRGEIGLAAGVLLAFAIGAAEVVWEVPGLVYCGRSVPRATMAGALSLSTLYPGVGRIVGGVAAGWMLTTLGGNVGFGVVSLILGLSMLSSLMLNPLDPASEGTRPMRGEQVLPWFSKAPAALALVALGASAAVFSYSYLALAPVIAQRLLHAGANGLGLITSGGGVGVLIAALITDLMGRGLGRGRTVALTLVAAGLSVLGLGLSSAVLISVALAGLLACTLGIYSATNNLLLQALAPLPMRGRVLSAFYLVFWGLLPVGTTLAGLSSDRFGTRTVLYLMGGLTLLAVVVISGVYRSSLRLDLDAEGLPVHA